VRDTLVPVVVDGTGVVFPELVTEDSPTGFVMSQENGIVQVELPAEITQEEVEGVRVPEAGGAVTVTAVQAEQLFPSLDSVMLPTDDAFRSAHART
jgi:hypothetical protein